MATGNKLMISQCYDSLCIKSHYKDLWKIFLCFDYDIKITVYSYQYLLNSTLQMGVSLNDTNNTGVTGIERVVPMCTEEIACLDLGFGRPVLSCLKGQ